MTHELDFLRAENARLIALVESHGIEWRLPQAPAIRITAKTESTSLTTEEKLALFRRLFQGRTDVISHAFIQLNKRNFQRSGITPWCIFWLY